MGALGETQDLRDRDADVPVGLHGRAFVPMVSGFACAIPAVMATRTLESRKDRLLCMMVVTVPVKGFSPVRNW